MLLPSRSRYIKQVDLLQALTSLLKYVQEDLLFGARDSLLCLTYVILSAVAYVPLGGHSGIFSECTHQFTYVT